MSVLLSTTTYVITVGVNFKMVYYNNYFSTLEYQANNHSVFDNQALTTGLLEDKIIQFIEFCRVILLQCIKDFTSQLIKGPK